MLILIFLAIVPLLSFVALLTSVQTRLILPARVNSVDAPDPALGAEYISIPTTDGNTLHGILFAPKSGKAETLILAFPGNTHNPVGFATFLKTKVFPEENTAIAALSYRGYPNGITPPSTGTPSQKAMYEDSLTVYDTLATRLKPTEVKVVGYSIGTSVATYLATQRKVQKLALLAPFASIRRLAQGKYPWLPVTLLLRHPFPTEDLIPALTMPTTIIYSPTDGLIPEAHVTQILHGISPSIPLIAVPNTSHNTLVLAPEIPRLIRNALLP